MEPTTEEKIGLKQEKNKYLIVSVLAAILVLAAGMAVFMTRNRDAGTVIAKLHVTRQAVSWETGISTS